MRRPVRGTEMKGCAKLFVIAAAVCFGMTVLLCAGGLWIGSQAIKNPERAIVEDGTENPPLPPDPPREEKTVEADVSKESTPESESSVRGGPLTDLGAEDLLGPLRKAGYSVDRQIFSIAEAKKMSVEHRYAWTCTDPTYAGDSQRRSVYFEGDGPDSIFLVEVSLLHSSLTPAKFRDEAEEIMPLVARIILGVEGGRRVRGALAQLGRDKRSETDTGSEIRFIWGNREVWVSATRMSRAMGIHPASAKDIASQEQVGAEDEEVPASRMLQLAKQLMKQGDQAAAQKRLEEILDRFPDTRSAVEAAEILKGLK